MHGHAEPRGLLLGGCGDGGGDGGGAGSLVIPGIRPTDANWFDDGSFARWSARLMPDPSEALADLAQLLEEPSLVALTRGIGWVS